MDHYKVVSMGLRVWRPAESRDAEKLLCLSLVTLAFEDGVSFFQQAVPLGLILFGQCIPNLFQPGCQVQFHDLSLAYRGLKCDQVFTLLGAEAKGIARPHPVELQLP